LSLLSLITSLDESGVLLSEFGYVALDHLEASISSKDFVQGVGDAILVQLVFMLEESLLLAWVHDNNAWHVTLLKLENTGEVGLHRHVEAHEVKGDSTLDLAREKVLDVVHFQNDGLVRLTSLGHEINDAEDTVLLQANIVCTIFAEEGHWFGEPWFASARLDILVVSSRNHEGLRVDVDEFEQSCVAIIVSIIDDRFFLTLLEDLEGGEFSDLVLAHKRVLI